MSPNHSFTNHYHCCGIQITFYEQCGHVLTRYDHHRSCPYHFSPPASDVPLLQCKDLHRYIRFIDAKCTCSNSAPQNRKVHPTSSCFNQCQPVLSKEETFERGVYWLDELLLAREQEYQGKLADWEDSMRERKEVEEAFKVPYLERTFGYDAEGLRGDFLGKVEVSKASTAKKRYAMSNDMGGDNLRRLPCGCVLDLKCIRRWFAASKCCPLCRVPFRLVKVPRREGSGQGEDEFPIWEDDGYSSFI